MKSPTHSQLLRLGAGAGFAGDRIDPAVTLAQHASLDYLIFECLGERTVALGHLRKQNDPASGYDPLLVPRILAVLPHTLHHGTTIITNGGAAHPAEGTRAVVEALAQEALPRTVRIATVLGDDVFDQIRSLNPTLWETGRPLSAHEEELISANAYLGAEALLPALEQQADIIITGRTADPSLYLAPMQHHFGWGEEDYAQLGAGTCVGHLLECAGQLTGGYFADPLTKPVPGMADLGFPFVEIDRGGNAELAKLSTTGGILDPRTCREQLLYEVSDPHAYLTPDLTADFSSVEFHEIRQNRVQVTGASGRQRPDQLKASLGFRGGWSGEGQISYAGPRATDRAQLARDIVTERLEKVHGIRPGSLTSELIGTGSAFRGLSTTNHPEPPEVRLRVSGRFDSREKAELVGWEVESLYTNGPAGGGGARRSTTEVVIIRSALIPREAVAPSVHISEVSK